MNIFIKIIFFLSFVFIALIELITDLKTIRNNALVQVIARTVFAVTTVYLSFQKLSTTSLFVKIITVVATLIMILQVIIPQKIGIILLTINLLILGIVSICAYLKKQEYTFLIYAEVVLCFIRMCKLSLSFSFEGSGLVFPIIAIVAAAIVLACLGVYFYLKRNRNNERKLLTVLIISILFTFLLFMQPCDANFAEYLPEAAEVVRKAIMFQSY